MIEIVPAILPENVGELRAKASFVKEFAKTVQIDFCDGIFVKSKTWPFNGTDTQFYKKILDEEEGLPFWNELDYEFDLMVKNAHRDFTTWIKLGPRRVVFHIRAEENLLSFFETLDQYYKENVEFGLAIEVEMNIDSLEPYIPYISFVQCMGIVKDGFQGEQFDERVINHVKELHERYPELTISVDGGVNLRTGTLLAEAGATKLVVGSALFGELDIKARYDELTHLL